MLGGGWLRAGVWLASSVALALVGFGAVVFGIYGLARALGSVGPEDLTTFRVMLAFYFKLVCFRGLLPCLLLALVFWPVVARVLPGLLATRARLLAGLLLAAVPAYAIVGPWLLTAQIDSQAALRMRSLWDHLATAVGIIGGVALAAWIPRAFLPPLRTPAGESGSVPGAGA